MTSENTPSSGLLGALLLPGFTDAGANTAFRADNSDDRHAEEEARKKSNTSDDQLSEAATEIHDNRTMNRHLPTATTPTRQLHATQHLHVSTDDSGAQHDKLLRSPRSTDAATSRGFFPSTKPTTPRPKSPLELTRQTLQAARKDRSLSAPDGSVAGTSVIPETGATSLEPSSDVCTPTEASVDEKRDKKLSQRGDESSDEKKVDQDESFPIGAAPLNASNLKRIEEQEQEKNIDATESITDDSSKGETNRFSSLLDGTNKGLCDEVLSQVSSTASEYGTVINIGSTRMAEVDAMADLAEAGRSVDDDDDAPMTTTAMHRDFSEIENSLALPSLGVEAVAKEDVCLLQRKELSNGEKSQHETHIAASRKRDVHAHSTRLAGGRTTHQSSAQTVSAAIRRIGSGLKTLSAPTTPKTPTGVPPRVEDLLKSTLTPQQQSHYYNSNKNIPASFALRSPGSGAHQSIRASRRLLTPRFSSRGASRVNPKLKPRTSHPHLTNHNRSIDQLEPLPDDEQPRQFLRPSSGTHNPFGLVQKCFSYDSTLDDSNQRYYLSNTHATELNTFGSPKQTHSWDLAFRSKPHPDGSIGGLQATASQELQRARLGSDFSPTKTTTDRTLALQTPQRMDLEREDALDILSCLVERGIAAWNTSADSQDDVVSSVSDADSLVTQMTGDLREAMVMANLGKDPKGQAALEELLKSHTYAVEMKRAALSASVWLSSIGRHTRITPDNPLPADHQVSHATRTSESGQSSEEENFKNDGTYGCSKIEVLTLNSMLNAAQKEVTLKTETVTRMNEELFKCKEEIGRLRSVSRLQSNEAQNRSVFDVDVVESNSSSLDGKLDEDCRQTAILANIKQKKRHESIDGDQSLCHDLQASLKMANDTIEKLYRELGHEDDDAPVVEVPSAGVDVSLQTSQQSFSGGHENRTINVRMLDGENFVTEWDVLRPPLPPPPDHGLRSPIVQAVLDQWSPDRGLHEPLVNWVERVMTSDELNAVPPLTISSLDHQVRDGFTMHVLPVILRRADIHVEVQTRAHRNTLYDLAVSVRQKTQAPVGAVGVSHSAASGSLLDQHTKDEWAEQFEPVSDGMSVTHSAVTEQIVNGGVRATLRENQNYDDEGYSSFGIPRSTSRDGDEDHQPGLMGALGGALGGLLSRRKYSVSSPTRSSHEPSGATVATTQRSVDLTASPVPSVYRDEEDQPYHRVVSAPPGRIGVTFMDFRGHAMVSDVAPDSPLSSWIFPSDILIAVDEVPVSGMRVRDIIKVLTTRGDSQRDLRVISSHAMNEFTLNQSVLHEEEP